MGKKYVVHLLVLIFRRKNRKICFEDRKGVGNGNVSTRQDCWNFSSDESRKGLEGGTDLYSFCHSCMNYSWASSEVILKSYSEMREQTAWSAEF